MNEERLYGRVLRWQAFLAVAGCAGWWAARDLRSAASFLAGAAASGVSFWLLHQMVAVLSGSRIGAWRLALIALRLVLIGGLLSVIITTYELQTGAAACGILITVAAILLEVIREHYA